MTTLVPTKPSTLLATGTSSVPATSPGSTPSSALPPSFSKTVAKFGLDSTTHSGQTQHSLESMSTLRDTPLKQTLKLASANLQQTTISFLPVEVMEANTDAVLVKCHDTQHPFEQVTHPVHGVCSEIKLDNDERALLAHHGIIFFSDEKSAHSLLPSDPFPAYRNSSGATADVETVRETLAEATEIARPLGRAVDLTTYQGKPFSAALAFREPGSGASLPRVVSNEKQPNQAAATTETSVESADKPSPKRARFNLASNQTFVFDQDRVRLSIDTTADQIDPSMASTDEELAQAALVPMELDQQEVALFAKTQGSDVGTPSEAEQLQSGQLIADQAQAEQSAQTSQPASTGNLALEKFEIMKGIMQAAGGMRDNESRAGQSCEQLATLSAEINGLTAKLSAVGVALIKAYDQIDPTKSDFLQLTAQEQIPRFVEVSKLSSERDELLQTLASKQAKMSTIQTGLTTYSQAALQHTKEMSPTYQQYLFVSAKLEQSKSD